MCSRLLLLVSLPLVLAFVAGARAGEEKLPVPDKAAVAEAEKQIRDILKDEYAGLAAKPAEAKKALAEKLLQQGVESKTNLALCYASLKEAIALSIQAGDAQTALKAADEIEKTFQGDALQLKLDALNKIGAALTSAEAAKELVRQCLSLIDQLAAADNYDDAVKVGTNASTIARKTQDQSLVAQVQQKGQDLQRLQVEYAKLKTAEKTLAEKPDDPAANLAMGRFVCFVKSDWKKGLPLLAKGSDKALQGLAAQEAGSAGNNDALLLLADSWWDAAKKEQGGAAASIKTHSAEIYAGILPKLPPLQATKVETRLDETGLVDKAECRFGVSKKGQEFMRIQDSGADAVYEIVEKYGKGCIVYKGPALRCTVDDDWERRWGMRNRMELEIEYCCEGSGALAAAFPAKDSAPFSDVTWTRRDQFLRTGAGIWKVMRLALPPGKLHKGQEGWHFMLSSHDAKDVYISRIALCRLKGTSPTGGK